MAGSFGGGDGGRGRAAYSVAQHGGQPLQQAASQATAVAAAYEAAHTATVPPQLVSINRAVTAALANANLLGLYSAAIAQKEVEYAEMWAQDVIAMGGYHAGASAAWSQLGPVQQLLQRLCRPGKTRPYCPRHRCQ